MSVAERAQRLLDLHLAEEVLVVVNAWDVASAKVLQEGAGAIATASHAIAATFGYEDGERIPLELHLDMVRRIVDATPLPVSADLEAGYGDPAETVRRAIDVGVVGANLEDGMRPLEEAVAAVEAALAAGDAEGVAFVLNARTDAFLRAPDGEDPSATLAEAIRRGEAFLAAGAPCVFVPGVRAREQVEALVAAFGPQRLSLLGGPGALPVSELGALGVARVSVGPWSQRVALTALQAAAADLYAGGRLPEGVKPLT